MWNYITGRIRGGYNNLQSRKCYTRTRNSIEIDPIKCKMAQWDQSIVYIQLGNLWWYL